MTTQKHSQSRNLKATRVPFGAGDELLKRLQDSVEVTRLLSFKHRIHWFYCPQSSVFFHFLNFIILKICAIDLKKTHTQKLSLWKRYQLFHITSQDLQLSFSQVTVQELYCLFWIFLHISFLSSAIERPQQ